MSILWFFLPGILFLGIKTSYTDIRYGKIKNRDVVIGIIYAFLIYAGILIYSLFKGQTNPYYFLELGTNALFALAVAFGLWHFRIWSAADGKLFFAFALLIPLDVYQFGRYNWIPSLNFLFNMFIIGLVIMIILIIKRGLILNYKRAFFIFLRDFLKPKSIFKTLILLFGTYWIVDLIFLFLGITSGFLLRYALIIAILAAIPALLKKFEIKNQNTSIYLFVIISISRFIFDTSFYSLTFLANLLGLLVIWIVLLGFFRTGLRSLGKDLFSKEVIVKSLKPGMMLSDKITKTKRLNKKKIEELVKKEVSIITSKRYSYVTGIPFVGEDYLKAEAEGLTRNQIRKIKKLGFTKIRISSTIPFAPIIFLGVIITLLAKGNILILRHILFG